MRLEIGMHQGLHLTQELTFAQRIELRHALALRQAAQFEITRNEIVGEPEELLDQVLEMVIAAAPQQHQEMLSGFLGEPILKETILKQYSDVAVINKNRILRFVLDYFYNSQRGEFITTYKDAEDTERRDVFKVDRGLFMQAFLEPDKVAQEIKSLTDTLRANKAMSAHGITERRQALDVAELIKDHIATLENGFAYVCTLKNAQGEMILPTFCQELAIIRRFDVLVSERMQNRFAARFRNSEAVNARTLETAFMNTVAEYVMVSMGVVDPELFQLRKSELDQDLYLQAKAALREIGLDYDALCKKYALKPYGTIVWNQWKARGVKPTSKTDEQIRKFMVETVRQEKTAILEAINFSTLLSRIHEINREAKADPERDLNAELREVLVQAFGEDSFQKAILSLIREKWYQKLTNFYA